MGENDNQNIEEIIGDHNGGFIQIDNENNLTFSTARYYLLSWMVEALRRRTRILPRGIDLRLILQFFNGDDQKSVYFDSVVTRRKSNPFNFRRAYNFMMDISRQYGACKIYCHPLNDRLAEFLNEQGWDWDLDSRWPDKECKLYLRERA